MKQELENQLNEIYEKISEELNVPKSLYDKFTNSYETLGEYLSNNIENYDIRVFPQGSMRLGTTIKPISEHDDYDLDAVCEVFDFNDDAQKLKHLVGDTLKQSIRYSKLLKREEGTRCWTLEYSDETNFHMDILPSTPTTINTTQLKITHKDKNTLQYTYKISDPEKYALWFENKQKLEKEKIMKRMLEIYGSVESVPQFKTRTTLQKTIQLLKRHRDIMFSGENNESKPISIIITTLVAQVYTGEENIIQLIEKLCNEYINFIEIDDNQNYVIKNPVNENENFADKWVQHPDRKVAFFNWINTVKQNLMVNNFLTINSLENKVLILKKAFGDTIVNSVFENQGKESKELSKNNNLFIDNSKNGNLTQTRTTIPIKNHTFYEE